MNNYWTRISNWFWFNDRLTRWTVRFLMRRMMIESREDWALYSKLHEWQNSYVEYLMQNGGTSGRVRACGIIHKAA